jgi:hypothetical protein
MGDLAKRIARQLSARSTESALEPIDCGFGCVLLRIVEVLAIVPISGFDSSAVHSDNTRPSSTTTCQAYRVSLATKSIQQDHVAATLTYLFDLRQSEIQDC